MQVIWKICRDIAAMVPGFRFEQRPIWRVTFPNGGTIQMRSADNPDSLRGATLDLVVFDEAATAKVEAWPTLRPTLSIRGGKAMFISTPKGLNWFQDLFADADGLEDWERWSFPSVDNPWLPASDVEKARNEMSSLLFSQEYLAEFISTSSGMFRQDWFRYHRSRFEGDERFYLLGDEAVVPEEDLRTFHTVDLAWSPKEDADYTVISTWGLTKRGHLLLLDMIRGHFEGPDIVPQLRRAYDRFGGVLVVERATRQMSIIQEAVRTGLPVREVRAEKDKEARALPATARMEQGRVWFPAKAPWLRDIEEELLAFPAGRHDDFVDTLAYAVAQSATSPPKIHAYQGA